MPLTLHGRLSRRGVFLMMFGAIYGVIGAVTLAGPERTRFFHLFGLLSQVVNSDWWGLLWIVCGLLALVAGVATIGYRPGEVRDAYGFTALLIPPGAWTAFYAASMVGFLIGDGQHRSPVAILLFTLAWLVVYLVVMGAAFTIRARDVGVRAFARTYFARALTALVIAAYIATLVGFLITGRDTTTRATTGVVVWSLAWSTVLLISGWPDPPARPRARLRADR